MVREPIIWRPNAIPPDEWGAKSRDEQIAWWRESRSEQNTPNKLSMLDAPRLYKNGTITLSECFILICKRASEFEVAEFVTQCPQEILTMLREELSHYEGNDRTKWPRYFYMATYAPWLTPEEVDTSRELEQQALLNGIAILKLHFNGG